MVILIILISSFVAKVTIHKLTQTPPCETKDKSLTVIWISQKGAKVKCPSMAEEMLLLDALNSEETSMVSWTDGEVPG